MGERPYEAREYFWRNRVIIPLAIRVAGPVITWVKGATCHRYKPKSKTFLLVANHNESLDPGYEMISLRRYIRYVSSDHVVRNGLGGWLLNFFGTPIIKYRDHPKGEVTEDILATLRAGISVGLHAEGGMSFNGVSRYISPNTARLAKDAGCALITFRNVGGYFRSPRWKKHHRKGPLDCAVVREYSAEEIAAMTQEEVYELLCRDTYVNAYEEQRKARHRYTGEALAESCEVVLYQCPKCKGVGTLRSGGNELHCSCGYAVEMGEDGFFHDMGQGLILDNILDWDLWQREAVKEYLDTFRTKLDTPAFRDEEQTVVQVVDGKDIPVGQHGVLELYHDRIELRWETGHWCALLKDITRMDYVKRRTLLVVAPNGYFAIDAPVPRSATKYIDAWRYLTGRPNY